jgi:predicted membrane protein
MSNSGHEPDAAEKGIRFGCGFVLGGLFVFICVLREVHTLTNFAIVGCVVGALVCGWLAMRYGDEFWKSFPWWF